MVHGTAQSSAQGGFGPESDFTEKTVSIADGVLGYRECGSGPDTVVLLHGISSGSASWADCATLLGKQMRVIAWDAPGYGASTPLASPAPGAPDYAKRIDALLDALQIKQCLLVGHSLGALMAAAYSGLAGQKASGMLLISPALGYGGTENPQAAQVRDRRLSALHELGIEGMAENLPNRLLTDQAGQKARETVRRIALRLQPEGYTQAVELLCGDDINHYAPPATTTRVYCGEHDIVTTPEQSRQYAQRQGFPFALIPGAGHACYVEQPKAVAAVILEAQALLKVSART